MSDNMDSAEGLVVDFATKSMCVALGMAPDNAFCKFTLAKPLPM